MNPSSWSCISMARRLQTLIEPDAPKQERDQAVNTESHPKPLLTFRYCGLPCDLSSAVSTKEEGANEGWRAEPQLGAVGEI